MNGWVGGGLRVWVWGYGGISAVEKEGGRTVGGLYEVDVFFAPQFQAPGSPLRFRCWKGVLVSGGRERRGEGACWTTVLGIVSYIFGCFARKTAAQAESLNKT